MTNDGPPIENEIKLSITDLDQARRLLDERGFQILVERVFESNQVLDTPAHQLRSRGELLRVRQAGGRGVLTYKGPAIPGEHKRREELETGVDLAGVLTIVLQRLGFGIAFRYEKYRTEFHRSGEPGLVTLDETPIGNFLELEGDPAWVDRTAAELGFSSKDYILASYGALYFEHCREHGLEPGDMTFAAAPPPPAV